MGVWKDKTRKDWCYSFKYRGKQYAGRSHKTRREATAAREDRRKIVAEEFKRTLPGMAYKEAASLYLDYAERRFSVSEYKYKRMVYQLFQKHLDKDVMIADIIPQDVRSYLLTRPSNNNFNVHRKELSALFAYAIKPLRVINYNPCSDVDRLPHTPNPKRILSEQDVLRLIIAADPKTDERDLILTCIHTLGRIDEVLRLTWNDVNFEKKAVTLWTRKRRDGASEPDDLPMNDDLYDVLHSRYVNRDHDKWVFYNEKTGDRYYHRPKLMASLCKRAGIEPIGNSKRKIFRGKNKGKYKEVGLYFGFHALRHFVASHLADSGKVSTKAIQGLLRHKNLKTTEIYLHSIDESQRVAMAGIEGKFTSILTKVQPEGATIESEKESNAI